MDGKRTMSSNNDVSTMKPGIKTSEFWLTLITHLACIVLLAMIWRGELTPTFEYAEELLLGVIISSQTVYTNSRTKLKKVS